MPWQLVGTDTKLRSDIAAASGAVPVLDVVVSFDPWQTWTLLADLNVVLDVTADLISWGPPTVAADLIIEVSMHVMAVTPGRVGHCD